MSKLSAELAASKAENEILVVENAKLAEQFLTKDTSSSSSQLRCVSWSSDRGLSSLSRLSLLLSVSPFFPSLPLYPLLLTRLMCSIFACAAGQQDRAPDRQTGRADRQGRGAR